MKKLILFVSTTLLALTISAQALVKGGQFKDRILPMQGSVTKSDGQTIWGASGVQERFLDNGAEPKTLSNGKPDVSYWGGNVVKDADGLYHMFLAGWDATKNGHNSWPQSDVYHVTSPDYWGPYTLTSDYNIGKGHNPEVYKAKDGTYVMYVLRNNSSATSFQASSLNGPWKETPLQFEFRDRTPLTAGSSYSNFTFCSRKDGSVLAISRTGTVWVSKDGKSPFMQISDVCVYPQGLNGAFEDPVIWFDGYQYHHIVNDWRGCKAYYSRSIDGVHWTYEPGIAYDPSVSVHADGTVERWWKYERPRIFQDKEGRAVQLNMAVIDVKKTANDSRTDGASWTTEYDAANDIHTSKNIAMPLNPGLLIDVLNTEKITTATETIRVRVKAEEGFRPSEDLDISSLRFGSYSVVNNGKGAQVVASEEANGDLVLTFNGADTGIGDIEFAPKMIGRYSKDYINPSTPTATKGDFCFGYARLPYIVPSSMLSSLIPEIGEGSKCNKITVGNYGVAESVDGMQIKILAGSSVISTGTVPAVKPYEKTEVNLVASKAIPANTKELTIAFYNGTVKADEAKLALTAAIACQNKFAEVIAEANELYNSSFKYGKEELYAAITEAKKHSTSYYEAELAAATTSLQRAINSFKFANASSNNPVSITIENADMASLEGWEILNTESKGFHINSSNNHSYNALGSNPFMEAYYSGGIASPNYAQQTFKDMPVGKYVFSADVIAQKGTGGCTGVALFVNNITTNCSSTQANFSKNYSVELILTEVADITVGLKIASGSDATWVGFDNAELKYYGDGTHDNDPVIHNISCKNFYLKTANSNSGNIYCYVDAKGTFARKSTKDNSSIFTIIRDGENNRNYIYNPSSKTFIAYESEWKASSTNAFVIPDIASSASLSKAYIIRGGAGANTYLNAKGGTATHTDFAAYNGTDANSQWSFEECTNQTYTFDVTDINTGLAEFLATASLIEDATIIPGSTSIRNICTEQDKTNSCIFSVSGQMLRALQKGINIVNGRKVLVY